MACTTKRSGGQHWWRGGWCKCLKGGAFLKLSIWFLCVVFREVFLLWLFGRGGTLKRIYLASVWLDGRNALN
jgi:hypothetical protein